jgi:hypothetical protein
MDALTNKIMEDTIIDVKLRFVLRGNEGFITPVMISQKEAGIGQNGSAQIVFP